MFDLLKKLGDYASQIIEGTSNINHDLLNYKIIYYAKGAPYDELTEYVERFDFKKSTIQKQISKYINEGYLKQTSGVENIVFLKVPDIKTILRTYGLKVSGRKDELIERLQINVPENELLKHIPNVKYLSRTDKGAALYKEMYTLRSEQRKSRYAEEHSSEYKLKLSLRTLEQFRQEGVRTYSILCENDSCQLCKQMSKKVIPISSAKIGANIPPLHDGCRCCITADD